MCVNLEMKDRIVDNNWNFNGVNTKEFTHCYHIYPAMMIPQVARKILNEYLPENTQLIFDPYCGSGTTLVESKLLNIDSIGTDLNPLAQLIAKSKVTEYNLDDIIFATNMIADECYKFSFYNDESIKLVEFFNISYWFSEKVIKEISFLLDFIYTKVKKDIIDFFLVALSETLREVSYTRNSEYKLYRMPENKLSNHNPDTFGLFLNKIKRNIVGLKQLILAGVNTKSHIYNFDTCTQSPKKYIERPIDFVVTSPPYGDSRTTVAYGQFSRLSNQWLGISNPEKIDSLLMGGTKNSKFNNFSSKYAERELLLIRDADEKRYFEVQDFLIDYQKSIKNIANSVRQNGRVAYVVGNRTVKNVQIPLDFITVELFENYGFNHLKTIVREIPSKRMPRENSPTNQTGVKSKTMNNEYIVIMEKL